MTTDLKALAEKAWNGELDTVFEHHPVHSFYDGATELEPGLLALKGIAGIYIVDTGGGLVMLDAGHLLDIDRTFEAVRQWRPTSPVVAAVFSHHHVDHIFATQRFDEEAQREGRKPVTVYAHELTAEHFDRYRATIGWNTAINRRQFAIDAPSFSWPDEYRYPDVTYRDSTSFNVGDLTFELNHARGETDDHTWTWIPERAILAPGDLFIWALPNAGNPQKVQRYVSDWADALDAMVAKEPELMIPGHGFAIFGRDRIRTALTDTATFLRTTEQQVLDGMNRGWSFDEVSQSVSFDERLLSKPYLRPVYDDARFLIRMIWRRYGGWWDGEFDTLLPAPKSAIGAEWIALAGGIDAVLDRALQLIDEEGFAEGFAVACHLVEAACHACPEHPRVHEVRARVYRARSQMHQSSMARNILNHAALASDQGCRDLASRDH